MKILFVNTHYYLPQSHGGMANTLHQLCLNFRSKGHNVSVLSGFRTSADPLSLVGRLKIAARKRIHGIATARDMHLSYPVWRSWHPQDVLEYVARIEKPDIIVIMGGAIVLIAGVARSLGIPILLQVHDVEEEWHKGDFKDVIDLPLIANSNFTADIYRKRYGADAKVIYPYMPLNKYKVENKGKRILFINPIFRKGLRKAHEIAKLCSDIPFTFVGSLPEIDEEGRTLDHKKFFLPNVTFKPFSSDTKEIYSDCRILLVPSQWEEAYGRVVNEAQISGIPVLASTRGGVPEAVDKGGLLLDADAPSQLWAETLRNIYYDKELYDELSRGAISSAARPELDAETQTEAQIDAMQKAVLSFSN